MVNELKIEVTLNTMVKGIRILMERLELSWLIVDINFLLNEAIYSLKHILSGYEKQVIIVKFH